jgi:hypothetical protein
LIRRSARVGSLAVVALALSAATIGCSWLIGVSGDPMSVVEAPDAADAATAFPTDAADAADGADPDAASADDAADAADDADADDGAPE